MSKHHPQVNEQGSTTVDEAGLQPVEASAPDDAVEAVLAQLAAVRAQLAESDRERTSAAERERLVRNEAQHRVRNMLALIRSILSRSLAADDDPETMAQHFSGRLDAIARSQSARDAGLNGSSDLENLIRDELKSFEFDERITIAGPDVAVPHELAQLLTLAIHELVTNAIKFGALASEADTRLDIAWTCTDRVLALSWEEKGVAVLASAPLRSGFGRELIERALPYQAGATSRFELRPGGLSCQMKIPLDQEIPAFRNWM